MTELQTTTETKKEHAGVWWVILGFTAGSLAFYAIGVGQGFSSLQTGFISTAGGLFGGFIVWAIAEFMR